MGNVRASQASSVLVVSLRSDEGELEGTAAVGSSERLAGGHRVNLCRPLLARMRPPTGGDEGHRENAPSGLMWFVFIPQVQLSSLNSNTTSRKKGSPAPSALLSWRWMKLKPGRL